MSSADFIFGFGFHQYYFLEQNGLENNATWYRVAGFVLVALTFLAFCFIIHNLCNMHNCLYKPRSKGVEPQTAAWN
jgi:hypothetical protein